MRRSLFRDDDTRSPARRARALLGQAGSLVRLPPPVAWFYLRALAAAYRHRDRWSLDVVTRPRELAAILAVARGRTDAVEIGTGTAWTAIALALADPRRTVLSLDPVVRPQREAYLRLVAPGVRARITLQRRPGDDPPPGPAGVDFLFVDGAHDEESTVAAYRAWEDRLAPGACVAFHDYGDPAYPGVSSAVARLGLTGTSRNRLLAHVRPGRAPWSPGAELGARTRGLSSGDGYDGSDDDSR